MWYIEYRFRGTFMWKHGEKFKTKKSALKAAMLLEQQGYETHVYQAY